MFKKFKDKLAEEMKQSPARLQASMQQLAQAVVSPAPSNTSIQDLSASYENFSLTEEGDETPQNSPAKHGFQNVDLTSSASNSMGLSRRSSITSVTSDASSLFPIYESPGNMYHLQSDVEQSASEVEDSISSQLDRVTKDQLYSAYRKVQAKYNKYRGRYTDLARHYRELDRENTKAKSVLVETQDKALRRIADLKEQCQLEQQAKAHLEEALQTDIEERDHLINTLNTKIKLLQVNVASTENLSAPEAGDQNENRNADFLIDLANDPSPKQNDNSSTETVQLKDKIKKLEALLTKCKDSMKRNKDKIAQLTQDRDILERDYDLLKNTNTERFKVLERDLNGAINEILELRDQINILQKREEESVISLAENKLSIHRELEVKEEQIKQLQVDLKQVTELKENLGETADRYRIELEELKLIHDNQNFDAEKKDLIQDLSKGKSEALKLMQQEMQQKLIDLEEKMGMKYHKEVERNKDLLEKLEKLGKEVLPDSVAKLSGNTALEELNLELKEKDSKMKHLQEQLTESESLSENHKMAKDGLEIALSDVKTRYDELKTEYAAQKIILEEHQKEVKTLNGTVQNSHLNQNAELEKFKIDLSEKDQTCKQLQQQIQEYKVAFEKVRQKLLAQDSEIKSLEEKILDNDEVNKLQDEMENKEVELLGLRSELKSCKSTINDLREKLTSESSSIKQLTEEKVCLLANILNYKKMIGTLREDCEFIKSNVDKNILGQKSVISIVNQKVQETVANEIKASESKNQSIKQQLEILEAMNSKLQNDITSLKSSSDVQDTEGTRRNELLTELEFLRNKVGELEPLQEINNDLGQQIEQLHSKLKDYDRATAKHKDIESELFKTRENYETLTKEKDSLQVNHKRTVDEMNSLKKELTGLVNKVAEMREKADKFDDISSKNKSLIAEIDGLNFKAYDIEELQTENKLLHSEIVELKELRRSFDDLATENQKLSDEINVLSGNLSKSEILTQQVTDLKQELTNLSEKYKDAVESVKLLKSENVDRGELLQQTENLKTALDRLMNDCAEKNTEIETLMAKCAEQNHSLKDLGTKYEEQLRLLEELTEKLAKREVDYQELNDKYILETLALQKVQEKCTAHSAEIEDMRKKETEISKQLQDTMRVKNETIKKFKEFKAQRNKIIQEKTDELEELKSKNTEILKELETSENIKNESLKVKLDEIATLTERNTELTKEIDHLRIENREVEALRNNNSSILSELEQLKMTNNKINLENKELKEKQNELLKTNAELQRSEEISNGKLAELENGAAKLQNEIVILREELESNRGVLSSQNSDLNREVQNLRTKLIEYNTIQSERTKLSEEIENLRSFENKTLTTLEEARKRNEELSTEISRLQSQLKDSESVNRENSQLLSEISELKSRVFELKTTETANADLKEETENLRSQILILETVKSENAELKTELQNQTMKIATLENAESENVKLNSEINNLKAEITSSASEESRNAQELSSLETKNMDLSSEMKNLNFLINEKVAELKLLDGKNAELLNEIDKLKSNSSGALENKIKEIDELRNKTKELEKKFNDRQQEIDLLKATNGELHEQLQNVNESRRADETLTRNNNKLTEDKKQLEAQLDEALLTFQAKESQMQIINDKLKEESDKLKDQLKNSEEEQTMRLKQLVKEFQAQLHDKDDQIQAALEKRFDRQQNYESDLIQQYKEQLKDFQVELTAKSEQIEMLITENKEANSEKQREVEKLGETIAQINKDHTNELKEIENKWKSVVKQRTDQLEAKHGEEVNELTKEWRNERRTVANSHTSPEELESTSRVAMAAVQSNTGSLHSLQQTLVSQRLELSELRKVLKMRSDTLEDSTEIEYLRNILFEYMMGRETVVLARVIAAVVKFDQEQTTKILKKEEDKLTLLGSLGLT